jgi:hypothetical protein
MYCAITGFVKIGALNNILFSKASKNFCPCIPHELSDFREIWCNRHITLFSACEFRENWCIEGCSFLMGVNEITFRTVL